MFNINWNFLAIHFFLVVELSLHLTYFWIVVGCDLLSEEPLTQFIKKHRMNIDEDFF